jgi:hypothetical protein
VGHAAEVFWIADSSEVGWGRCGEFDHCRIAAEMVTTVPLRRLRGQIGWRTGWSNANAPAASGDGAVLVALCGMSRPSPARVLGVELCYTCCDRSILGRRGVRLRESYESCLACCGHYYGCARWKLSLAQAADATCFGLLNGIVDGNVVVPGAASCTRSEVTVSGRIKVSENASLAINATEQPTTIGGDVDIDHCVFTLLKAGLR